MLQMYPRFETRPALSTRLAQSIELIGADDFASLSKTPELWAYEQRVEPFLKSADAPGSLGRAPRVLGSLARLQLPIAQDCHGRQIQYSQLQNPAWGLRFVVGWKPKI